MAAIAVPLLADPASCRHSIYFLDDVKTPAGALVAFWTCARCAARGRLSLPPPLTNLAVHLEVAADDA